MADFDNGIPPNGTDVSGNSVSSVLLDAKEVSEAALESIKSLHVETADISDVVVENISSISIQHLPGGINYGGFL